MSYEREFRKKEKEAEENIDDIFMYKPRRKKKQKEISEMLKNL